MIKIIFTLFCLLLSTTAHAKTYGDLDKVTFIECYDGDTCYFDIPNTHPIIGDRIGIRVRGIDTPEIRGKCQAEKQKAVLAREVLSKSLAKAKQIELKNIKRGKYFRIVATVMADGVDVSRVLIQNKLAVVYNGKGQKMDWCSSYGK